MLWCIDYFNTSSSGNKYSVIHILLSNPDLENSQEKIKEVIVCDNSSTERQRTPLHCIEQNVKQNQLQKSSTRRTMRRFPPRQNFPYKYSVLPRTEMTNGYSPFCQSMPPPVSHGDSFSRHMAEIEFWVKTHRPPCTYGMPLPPQEQNNINAQRAQNILVSTKVEENKQNNDSDIKRPIDPPDISPVKSTRKKLLTVLGHESEPSTSRELFPSSQDSPPTLAHKTNGTCVPGITSTKSKTPRIPVPKNVNGNVSSASTKKSRARPTSTPITNRMRNVDAGKKAKSVANKTTPKRTRTPRTQQKTKLSTGETVDLETESPAVTPGPSNADNVTSREVSRDVADDSDTSVLTAPYIRSTRNSASKSKCQTLTRQRASLAKANKYFPPRAADKSDIDMEATDPVENQDASAHDTSGALNTTDSSLDILPDISKISSIKSKNGTRVSSIKNVRTLHFAGSAKSSNLKRRSEPVVTRLATKRAKSLLCNGQANVSSDTNEEQMSFGAVNVSAPCVSRVVDAKNTSRGSILLDSDEPTRRKKFFV